jgi:hypothetical protein
MFHVHALLLRRFKKTIRSSLSMRATESRFQTCGIPRKVFLSILYWGSFFLLEEFPPFQVMAPIFSFAIDGYLTATERDQDCPGRRFALRPGRRLLGEGLRGSKGFSDVTNRKRIGVPFRRKTSRNTFSR